MYHPLLDCGVETPGGHIFEGHLSIRLTMLVHMNSVYTDKDFLPLVISDLICYMSKYEMILQAVKSNIKSIMFSHDVAYHNNLYHVCTCMGYCIGNKHFALLNLFTEDT